MTSVLIDFAIAIILVCLSIGITYLIYREVYKDGKKEAQNEQ